MPSCWAQRKHGGRDVRPPFPRELPLHSASLETGRQSQAAPQRACLGLCAGTPARAGVCGTGGGRGYNLAIGVSSQHQAKNLTRSSARLSGVGETSAKGTPGAGTWLQGPGSGMWHGLWASHCPGVFAAAQPLLVSRWSSLSPAAVFSSSVTQAAGILSPLCPLVPSHAAIRGAPVSSSA